MRQCGNNTAQRLHRLVPKHIPIPSFQASLAVAVKIYNAQTINASRSIYTFHRSMLIVHKRKAKRHGANGASEYN